MQYTQYQKKIRIKSTITQYGFIKMGRHMGLHPTKRKTLNIKHITHSFATL
jgi:hypothetical protein